jgi:hypothetical protein
MPSQTESGPLDSFEVQLISYMEYLKSVKPATYLSYRRSAAEEPLFFHDGLKK